MATTQNFKTLKAMQNTEQLYNALLYLRKLINVGITLAI
jgi:hypothetical protein